MFVGRGVMLQLFLRGESPTLNSIADWIFDRHLKHLILFRFFISLVQKDRN